ncbi:PLP-dependent aminotransferase family protein [Streptomyces sp. CB01881]|uniref:aminotransferase-like domain-containing protein n=1 Tax=Streptomyces sp. CB01881 TaxID=2078691 RepID=UPI0019D62B71|nr:PLP-dependent aminotransferase family protein [Streptomyces sp. CB01881]
MDRIEDPSDPAGLIELLGDWTSGPGPRYRSLAAAVARAIGTGDLRPGERLPAERRLADALAVSRATVVAAYDALRVSGLVESRRGSGTRVVRAGGPTLAPADGRLRGNRAGSIVQRLLDRPDDVISLGRAAEPGGPDLGAALAELVREDLPGLLGDAGYHPAGLPVLRAAVAAHHTAFGLPTTPDQVLVTSGATQAIGLAAQLFVGRGSTVLVESPGWAGCLDVFRAAGARLAGVGIDDDGIRIDGLAAALAEHRPALLYVMPTYQNPTGVLMSQGRRHRVAELAAAHGVTVLEDSAHEAALAPGRTPAPIAAAPAAGGAGGTGAAVLTVGSLAKAVWGGLRIGWLRAPRPVVERAARLKALADLGSPLLDQALAARLLPRLPGLAPARAELQRQHLTTMGDLLSRELPGWRWRQPDGGSVLWIELPGGADARVFTQVALRHGAEVVPGAALDVTGAHDHYLRLPCSFPPRTAAELVGRLAGAWAEFSSSGGGEGGHPRRGA